MTARAGVGDDDVVLDPGSRRRILVLYASQRLTGPGRGLLQLITESGQKDKFTLCSFGSPGEAPSDFHGAATARGIDARVIRQRFALDPTMLVQSLGIAEEGYGLVQSHGYKTHVLAAVISWRMGIPWVAVSHGWTDENLRIRLYNRLDRMMLKRADTVIAVSPLLEETLSSLRPDRRTVTILNAIEPSRFGSAEPHDREVSCVREELRVPDQTPLLGIIGRLSPEKGQDQFLRSFARLSDRNPRPVAVLVGEGPEEEQLRNLAVDLGVDGHVRFVGFQRNVEDYFRAADVIVLPSRSEGLPNVVLEAHALRRPVVAFDVGGVSEVIRDGETGWLVPAGDVGGLAEAVAQALDKPGERARVVESASRALFPKFGVKTRVDAFFREYDLLTSSSER